MVYDAGSRLDRGDRTLLSAIVAVTLLVPDVHAAERAWRDQLHYQTVEQGRVGKAQARTWDASRTRDREYVVMRAASGEPVFIRFVASKDPPAPALKRLGWNVAEILVEDPPQLEQQLAGTPFKVVGPAAPLEINPAVVAMQALGPSQEMLYFTRIPAGKSKFNLGSATSFVDRVFIVVAGVHDIRRTLDFYAETFGMTVTDPAPSRVEVLADAWGLPKDTRFPLAIVRLPERFLIEVDEYPAGAAAPKTRKHDLPAGMAMVSFTVPSLDPYVGRLVAPPLRLDGTGYEGRRVGVMLGPSGEHIELIESAPPALQ
jgi:catechol 2,3-dioxygenase-like lactoylglutathione lyase family enzyme